MEIFYLNLLKINSKKNILGDGFGCAITMSTMTPGIMTFIITRLYTMTLSIMSLSTLTPIITTFSIITISINTVS